VPGNLVDSDKILVFPGIRRQHGDRFCYVHRASAAQADNAFTAFVFVDRESVIGVCHRRFGLNVTELREGNPLCFSRVHDFLRDAQLFYHGVGDHQNFPHAKFRGIFREIHGKTVAQNKSCWAFEI